MEKAADAGDCVIVGRGAPYFLRQRADAFHVFLYAPHAEKLQRLLKVGKNEREARELLDTIDRDRIDVRETLLRCRLAHPLSLSHDDQYCCRE